MSLGAVILITGLASHPQVMTAYVPPAPAGPAPAWAVALALAVPLVCIAIIAVGLVVRELRATRREPRPPRPFELCHWCNGVGILSALCEPGPACPKCHGAGIEAMEAPRDGGQA